MVSTMELELAKFYEKYVQYEIALEHCAKFHKKVRQERYKVVKAFMVYKLQEGEFICPYV